MEYYDYKTMKVMNNLRFERIDEDNDTIEELNKGIQWYSLDRELRNTIIEISKEFEGPHFIYFKGEQLGVIENRDERFVNHMFKEQILIPVITNVVYTDELDDYNKQLHNRENILYLHSNEGYRSISPVPKENEGMASLLLGKKSVVVV